MYEVFRPFFAHEFENLEHLFEMQILLIGNNVQALIKIVSVLAVDRRRQIAGRIQRRAVRTQDQTGGHIEFVEIDDLCALALFEQFLFVELVDHGLHFIRVEPFASITVERDMQFIVNLFNFL